MLHDGWRVAGESTREESTVKAIGGIVLLGGVVLFVGLLFIGPTAARGDSCPADEHDGVRVSACQIGDDIQVLAHNNNNYDVSVDVNVSFREKNGQVHSQSFYHHVDAGGGGEIGEIPGRDYSLDGVTDVTLKDVTKE